MSRKLLPGRKLLHLHMHQEAYDNLVKLQELTGASSLSETFRNALNLYDFAIHERHKGSELLIRRPGKRAIELDIVIGEIVK